MYILEFYFILFTSVSADMKSPHIGIGQYAFFHIETPQLVITTTLTCSHHLLHNSTVRYMYKW